MERLEDRESYQLGWQENRRPVGRLSGSSERGYRWSRDLVSIVASKERWACACTHLLAWCLCVLGVQHSSRTNVDAFTIVMIVKST